MSSKENKTERERNRSEGIGPFAPPTPAEVEDQSGGVPMAVANDEVTVHDAFMPTTAPGSSGSHKKTPEGYSKTDERGFRHPPEGSEEA